MKDKTTTWLVGVAAVAAMALSIAALIGLLVFDSIFLLRVFATLLIVAYAAALVRSSNWVTKRRRKNEE